VCPHALTLGASVQEDAAVAVWARSASPTQPDWRALFDGPGSPLALPAVVGHRGEVRGSCLCACDAPAPAADLAWLLHRPEGHTELLVRRVPLAEGGGGRECCVARLGRHADARQLFSCGGGDLWVWTARGVAYRWCLHSRACVARVEAGSGACAALHMPSRELLLLRADAQLLALSPPLRPHGIRDDGFAAPASHGVRRVGRLRRGGPPPLLLATAGPLLFTLGAASLTVHHARTGARLAAQALQLPGGGAGLQLACTAAGELLLWRSEPPAVWRIAPPAAPLALAAARAHAGAGTAAACASALGEASCWGGSLAPAEAALALALAHSSLREGCPPGSAAHGGLHAAAGAAARGGRALEGAHDPDLPLALHASLRSLAPVQALLRAQAGSSPEGARAAAAARAAACDLYARPASARAPDPEVAAAAFHAYTPLAAAIAPACLAAPALCTGAEPTSPPRAAAAALAQRFLGAPVGAWLGWSEAGLAVAAQATRECAARRDNAGAAALHLFATLLQAPPARAAPLCEAAACAACAARAGAGEDDGGARGLAAARLPALLARALDGSAAAPQQPLTPPPFEAVCLCLAATLPGALPAFVLEVGAAAAPEAGSHLALRALRILPPAPSPALSAPPGRCPAAARACLAAHAELMALSGQPCAATWLALQGASGQQPDWATAVRLLEHEATGAGGRTTVPLMFDILAARVCDALAAGDGDGDNPPALAGVNAEDESEALAACVAHLFIAAKTVSACLGRDAAQLHAQAGRLKARGTSPYRPTRLPAHPFLCPVRRPCSRNPPCWTRCTTCWTRRSTAGAAPCRLLTVD